MEPDHSALIKDVLIKYPKVKIVSNLQVFKMINQFFDLEIKLDNKVIVNENDILNLGNHNLKFIFAPMVHWPEVMVSYDLKDGILFSADAFGSFNCLSQNLFYNEIKDYTYVDEARRYYTNIVGKYGQNVMNLFKKLEGYKINIIAPLHGYLLKNEKDINFFISKYIKWASYIEEDNQVIILYASMYKNTEKVCNYLANLLVNDGIENVKLLDLSLYDTTNIIAEVFRVNHIVLAAPAYNSFLYPKIDSLLTTMKKLNVQNKTFAIIENYTWASSTSRLLQEELLKLKNTKVLEERLIIKSSYKKEDYNDLIKLKDAIKKSLLTK